MERVRDGEKEGILVLLPLLEFRAIFARMAGTEAGRCRNRETRQLEMALAGTFPEIRPEGRVPSKGHGKKRRSLKGRLQPAGVCHLLEQVVARLGTCAPLPVPDFSRAWRRGASKPG